MTIKNYKDYTVEELKEIVSEVNAWDGSLEDLEFHEMDYINDLLAGTEPLDGLKMANGGGFSTNDDYFIINCYGYLESFKSMYVRVELQNEARDIIERYTELIEAGHIVPLD